MRFFSLALIFLLVLSCNKKKSSSDDDDNESDTTIYEGIFESPCLDATGGLYIKLVITFEGNEYINSFTYYMDAGANTCSDASRIGNITEIGTFEVGDVYTDQVVEGATEAYKVNFTAASVSATAWDNGTSNNVIPTQANGYCSPLATWVSGVPVDVTGTECFGDGEMQAEEGQVFYEFIDIDTSADPVVIIPSDADADEDYDASTDEKRPINSIGISLTKVDE